MAKRNYKYLQEVLAKTQEVYGFSLRKQQIKAVKCLLDGKLIELPTGNGKTIVGVVAVTVKALQNKRVIVTSPNDYLTVRDCEYANKMLVVFGLKAESITSEEFSESQKHYAKIKYIPSDTLVFSYMCGAPIDFDAFLLMDEIDFTLVESADNTLNVSSGSDEVKINTFDYKVAMAIGEKLTYKVVHGVLRFDEKVKVEETCDYYLYGENNKITVTENGLRTISNELKSYIFQQENWKILDLVKTYLSTKHTLEKGRDYIVSNNRILRINLDTGRGELNSRFDYAINTFLEIQNDLDVTNKAVLEKGISYQVFYSKFSNLTGMSGTLISYRDDFSKIYSKDIKKIRAFTRSKLDNEGFVVRKTKQEKFEYTKHLIDKNPNRLALIICPKDSEVDEVANLLERNSNRSILRLNNYNLSQEADVIEQFRISINGVLVSTHILGRGVDIIIDSQAEEIGGILLIPLSIYKYTAADRQIAGRVARNGQKGEIITVLSLEDDINKIVYEKDRIKMGRFDLTSPANVRRIIRIIKNSRKRRETESFDARYKLFFLNNDIEKRVIEVLWDYEGLEKINMLHTLYFFFSLYGEDMRRLYECYNLSSWDEAELFAAEYIKLTDFIVSEARDFIERNQGVKRIK